MTYDVTWLCVDNHLHSSFNLFQSQQQEEITTTTSNLNYYKSSYSLKIHYSPSSSLKIYHNGTNTASTSPSLPIRHSLSRINPAKSLPTYEHEYAIDTDPLFVKLN
jgi:hypothetical protein